MQQSPLFSTIPINGNGVARPQTGESTARQVRRNLHGSILTSASSSLDGKAPDPGTYDTYRKMSAHPTLALARAIVYGPILAGSWSWQKKEEAPQDWLDLAKAQIDPQRPELVESCLCGVEMGWQPFEEIWEVRPWRGMARNWLKRFKPLLQDITEIVIDEHGNVQGLKQDKLILPPQKSFLFTYEGRGMNPYGRSRHENIRQLGLWDQWVGTNYKAGLYQTKVSGVICQIHYPIGWSEDATGMRVENWRLAERYANALARGENIIIPNQWASTDDPRLAAELAGKGQWVISFLNPGGADLAAGFIAHLRYLDSLFMRGWLRPERAATEGQNGTKAEAETHGDLGMLDGELLDKSIARAISRDPVNEVLLLNFGEMARDAVWIEASPLVDEKRLMFERVLGSILTSPGLLEMDIDRHAIYETLGIPHFTGNPAVPNAGALPPNEPEPLTPEQQAKMSRFYEALNKARAAGKAA